MVMVTLEDAYYSSSAPGPSVEGAEVGRAALTVLTYVQLALILFVLPAPRSDTRSECDRRLLGAPVSLLARPR